MKGKVEKIFTVFEGFKLKECDEIKPESDCLFWIKVIHTGQSHTTSYGNTWPVFEYLFYNKNNETFYYSKNGWWINWIRDPSVNTIYSAQELLIIDPKGKFRFLDTRYGNIHGVVSAIKFLENLGDYQDWVHFDLLIERDELIKKVESFKNTGIFKRVKGKFDRLRQSGDWKAVWELKDKPTFSKDFYDLWIDEAKVPDLKKKYLDYFDT